MSKSVDPKRFHHIVGYLFATGFFVFIGVPTLLISAMGECLPRETPEAAACDYHKRIEFFVLLCAVPLATILVGKAAFLWSRFLDGPDD